MSREPGVRSEGHLKEFFRKFSTALSKKRLFAATSSVGKEVFSLRNRKAPRVRIPARTAAASDRPTARAHDAQAAGLPLEAIERYLAFCLDRESPPRVTELARALGMSRGKLVETFRSHVGMTPQAYLLERRIETAKLLLKRTKHPIDKVGYMAGFGTRRTFFRAFHRATGMAPAWYRQGTK